MWSSVYESHGRSISSGPEDWPSLALRRSEAIGALFVKGHGSSSLPRLRFIITVTYGSAEPHSPPRRGGEDAPPIRWREATESGADGVVRPARPGFRRTDHTGAARDPSSARRGIRQRNFQTQH